MVKVAIIDSMKVYAKGLESVINSIPNHRVIGHAVSISELSRVLHDQQPHWIILECDGTIENNLALLDALQRRWSEACFMAIADGHIVPEEIAQLQQVAKCILNRKADVSDVIHALGIENTHAKSKKNGRKRGDVRRLTPREKEVVKLVGEGYSNRVIAGMLGLSEQSVKNLVSRCMRKIGVANRVQLVLSHREKV